MFKKKKRKLTSNRFFDTFAGEEVRIFTKVSVSEGIETEQGTIKQEAPMTVVGFLLDFDEEYYFVGDGPDQVSSAVKIDQVALIQEVKKLDHYDLMLEGADPRKLN
jgi:hypothetical protein